IINDWSTKSKPDLLHFVPYTWRLTVLLKEFELITLANESNWIDCSSQHQENSHIAICGDLFDFSFDLPFDDFLPATLPLRFWIQGESVDLALFLPEVYSITTDRVLNRTSKDKHLQQGHLMLSGLQIRGHAMFSDTGRSLDQETLEYAWQLEIQLGKLSGKFTSPQLYHVITGLETLVLLITDPESKLQAPRLPPECHHGIPPLTCPESDADGKYRCPSGDDIKYRMTRVCIDAIDLYLIESGTALNLWASPLRLATCNLHGNHVKAGVTAVLPAVRLRQLICAGQQQQVSNLAATFGNM
ncbi:transmembrane protein KIAA1109-like, partial [Diaphorina citri]|uniref:Transmembrane protein KIAA1109-like n=1 Tax=Diaphorina citri TaxID=121845 RepID=A0A1S4EQP0_DIACI